MRKIIIGLLCAATVVNGVLIFVIGGQLGAYAWNLEVFIIAPLAVITALVQIILLGKSVLKKKSIGRSVLFLLASILLSLPITVLLGISPIVYPASADPADAVIVKMPVEDAILFGGKDYKTHSMWPSECYAYDILKEPYDLDSADLNDYGIFACDVIAPISGVVIAAQNSDPDITPHTEEFTSSLGNHICIQIDATDTYLILAHLQEGSLLVEVGQHVEQGQLIAKVGNSGTTSEPHLHIQHQRNNPDDVFFSPCAEGLPIVFQ